MTEWSTEGLTGPTGYSSDLRIATSVLVDASPMTSWATLYRIVVPCLRGDRMRIYAETRMTNDIGPLTVGAGIGIRLGWYRYDTSLPGNGEGDLVTFPKSSGTNVDRSLIHHVQLSMVRTWVAPADWPEGPQRVVFRFIGDAHSSVWDRNGGGDRITVDDAGLISVDRWTTTAA